VYAVGGHNGTKRVATNGAYAPATNTWTSKTLMPTARNYLVAVAPGNGSLYSIGGYDATNSNLATNEEYMPLSIQGKALLNWLATR